jgi:hypothetical protein
MRELQINFAVPSYVKKAGDEARTHDPHVGNVMLYH